MFGPVAVGISFLSVLLCGYSPSKFTLTSNLTLTSVLTFTSVLMVTTISILTHTLTLTYLCAQDRPGDLVAEGITSKEVPATSPAYCH